MARNCGDIFHGQSAHIFQGIEIHQGKTLIEVNALTTQGLQQSAPSERRLLGTVAIVTGAGTGIGRATALALAREGADLALIGRRVEPLADCAEEAQETGVRVHIQPADVTDAQSVAQSVAATLGHFGRIDILVNNAGINTPRRLYSDTEVEDWQRVISTNLTGVFLYTRAVLPAMRQQKSGLVVNISSGAGRHASPRGGLAYSASKFGVVALTQELNSEEWANGIRATVVFPGEVVTPILHQRPVIPTDEHKAAMLAPEDIAAAVVFVVTMPARAIVEELVIRPSRRNL